MEDEGWTGERIRGDYDQLMEKVEEMDEGCNGRDSEKPGRI